MKKIILITSLLISSYSFAEHAKCQPTIIEVMNQDKSISAIALIIQGGTIDLNSNKNTLHIGSAIDLNNDKNRAQEEGFAQVVKITKLSNFYKLNIKLPYNSTALKKTAVVYCDIKQENSDEI